MHDFEYCRPARIDEAAAMAAKADYKVLAGGMSLIPVLKQRLAQHAGLVDLGAIDALKGIRREGNALVIGAMTPHAVVAASAEVEKAIPALAALAGGIGDPQVRNRGTIGGSIANADPAADYPAAVVGLGATVTTNTRRIAGEDFFTGLFQTALEPAEIVTAVSFPLPEMAGYAKFKHPASRFAIVGVFVAKTAGGVRVAVTGAGPSVFRLEGVEAALAHRFDPAALDAIEIDADGLNSDFHASAEYRAHCVRVMAKRAVSAALARS